MRIQRQRLDRIEKVLAGRLAPGDFSRMSDEDLIESFRQMVRAEPLRDWLAEFAAIGKDLGVGGDPGPLALEIIAAARENVGP